MWVRVATRSRIVAWKCSRKAVVSRRPRWERCTNAVARSSTPGDSCRVIWITRCVAVCDDGANLHLWPHTYAGSSLSNHFCHVLAEGSPDPVGRRPPAICADQERAFTQDASSSLVHQAASVFSRIILTVPASHTRVEIIARPIQTRIVRPFIRISSVCTGTRSRFPCSTST